MDRFVNALLNLAGLPFRMIPEQGKRIGRCFLILIAVFHIICLLQWCTHGNNVVNAIAWLVFFGSIFHYLKIDNIIREGILGEFPEALGIAKPVKSALKTELGNFLIGLREKMVFFTAIACMTVPSLPIWNHPWIIGAFSIGATTIIVLIWRTGGSWLRYVTWPTVIVYLTLHLLLLFPSVQARTGMRSVFDFLPDESVAKNINEFYQTERENKVKAVNTDLRGLLDWQKNNPGGKLPEAAEKFLEGARKGELKTLAEVEQELKNKPTPAPGGNAGGDENGTFPKTLDYGDYGKGGGGKLTKPVFIEELGVHRYRIPKEYIPTTSIAFEGAMNKYVPAESFPDGKFSVEKRGWIDVGSTLPKVVVEKLY